MPDMRFAPPPLVRVTDRGGGLNQTSVRSYNERLVMSLIRQHGQLSRLELGQLSGLSAQTISVIVRSLEQDSLIIRGEAQRGRVGPPTIPMSLNSDGAFAFGIKIGRYTTDVVLVDFLGNVRAKAVMSYAYPDLGRVLDLIRSHLNGLWTDLDAQLQQMAVGLGLTLPRAANTWPKSDWPVTDRSRWDGGVLEERLARFSGLQTFIQDDVTAAAGAEVTFGNARFSDDFAYFYLGAETTSRLVLNHRVYAGAVLGATAEFSTLPGLSALAGATDAGSPSLWSAEAVWDLGDVKIRDWLDATASGLADEIRQIERFVSLKTVFIDGRMPNAVSRRLAELAAERFGSTVKIREGAVGPLAKGIGAANLAFQSRFMLENITLISEDAKS